MAACDTLAEEAAEARQEAADAAKETKDEVQEAWDETRKATAACATAIGGFGVSIALGVLATPLCLEGIWDAATSWCEVRESGKDTTEAAKAASAAQTAYLQCLNEHKLG